MMRTRVVIPFVFAFASTSLAACAGAQQPTIVVRPLYDRSDDRSLQGQLSAREIDNLVAPIALYPDALLAQVLVAATFPDQINDAARYVRARGTNDIDDQYWDISVKSVAHYPTVLNMMTNKSDWTNTLGQVYAQQSSDVMESVQHLRRLAHDQGNLVSTEQQRVVIDNGNYVIVPAEPRVIYVPVYDPVVIYSRPVFYARGYNSYWSFGFGFPIGGWLTYDLDWRGRRVYYQGWDEQGYGYDWWRVRSRPYVQITNVYVNPRYESVHNGRDWNDDRGWDRSRDRDRDHGRDRATPPRGRNDGFDYRTSIPTTVVPRVGGDNNDGRNRGQGRDAQPRNMQPRDRQPRPEQQSQPREQPRMQPQEARHEQQPQARPEFKAPPRDGGAKPDERRPDERDGRHNEARGQFHRP